MSRYAVMDRYTLILYILEQAVAPVALHMHTRSPEHIIHTQQANGCNSLVEHAECARDLRDLNSEEDFVSTGVNKKKINPSPTGAVSTSLCLLRVMSAPCSSLRRSRLSVDIACGACPLRERIVLKIAGCAALG